MCSVSVSFSFVFKLKTAYEMRISDWSSDVCSSDLPQVTDLPTAALAGIPVADATLATGDFQAGAMAVGRSAGDDIDQRHQCIGAVADGVGAAENFDPLDVFHGHWNIAPLHRGQAGAIHRAATEQHLHAPGFGGVGAVAVHGGLVADRQSVG